MKIGGRKMNVCCMDLAKAVRIIGYIGLVVSIIVIISTLGATISMVVQNDQDETEINVRSVLIGVLIFSCCYLISNALLIYASYVKKWAFTVPWLVCEGFGIVSQLISLIIHAVQGTVTDASYFLTRFLDLAVMVYFGMCVLAALLEWKEESKDQFAYAPTPASPDSCRVGFDNSEVPSSAQIANLSV